VHGGAMIVFSIIAILGASRILKKRNMINAGLMILAGDDVLISSNCHFFVPGVNLIGGTPEPLYLLRTNHSTDLKDLLKRAAAG
jgi:hypothetical protein